MKKTIAKAKILLKDLFLTWQGWLSWIIANIITSLPWILPLVYGFVFKDNNGYIIAGSVWTFIMLPVTPFWILNVLIATFFVEKVFKKKKPAVL
jgi:hypothetical protein